MEEKKGPPKIVRRAELAPGEVEKIMGFASTSAGYEAGGGVLKYEDGTYGLQLTYREPRSQHVVDTDTTPLEGRRFDQVLTQLGIDKNLNRIPQR